MRIDLEEIEVLLARRKEINGAPLSSISWHRDGKPVEVSLRAIRQWEFVGMNNIDFAAFEILEKDAPSQDGG